jgi:periplasmic protein TonB
MPDPTPDTPASDDHRPMQRRSRDRTPPPWRPSRRSLVLVALAVLVGLLLFAMVWRGDRDRFYTVEPVARPERQAYDPLPAPQPARERERPAIDIGDSGQREEQAARIIAEERPPPPPPRPPEPVEAPPPPAAAGALARGAAPEPIPGQMPAPAYPRRALQRGEQGTVLVRAEVGSDGVPISVSLVQGSRSRELDRAALDAVRRWRFRPGHINGRPIVGSVVVPIEFRADR